MPKSEIKVEASITFTGEAELAWLHDTLEEALVSERMGNISFSDEFREMANKVQAFLEQASNVALSSQPHKPPYIE